MLGELRLFVMYYTDANRLPSFLMSPSVDRNKSYCKKEIVACYRSRREMGDKVQKPREGCTLRLHLIVRERKRLSDSAKT